jgi:conjugal transfer mating pair stabilization protein TraN
MIIVQISKQSFLERRNSSLFNCNYDSFGNKFCPSNLAKAESYWDYDNGFSIPKVGKVVDYTKKETTINYTQANYQLQKWDVVSYTCTNGGNPNNNCGKGLIGGQFKIANYDWINVTEANVLTGATNNYDGNDGGNGCGSNGIAVASGYGMTCLTVGKIRFQLTCPSGSVLENNQCKKVTLQCPQGYTETTGAEVAKGECKGNIDYSYYEYKCNEEKNGQNNNYQIINNGGDCNKSDTNNKTVNPELSNSCNSSTPPVNNCKRQGFKCNSNEIKPVYVNGEWQCSPFLCDSNMKCGYATCNSPSIPSTSKFQDVAYNPLNYIYNNKCNQDICDYVLNAQVSYCESSQCPKRDDVIEKNGLCYKMECPAGTYLSGDKCIKENF